MHHLNLRSRRLWASDLYYHICQLSIQEHIHIKKISYIFLNVLPAWFGVKFVESLFFPSFLQMPLRTFITGVAMRTKRILVIAVTGARFCQIKYRHPGCSELVNWLHCLCSEWRPSILACESSQMWSLRFRVVILFYVPLENWKKASTEVLGFKKYFLNMRKYQPYIQIPVSPSPSFRRGVSPGGVRYPRILPNVPSSSELGHFPGFYLCFHIILSLTFKNTFTKSCFYGMEVRFLNLQCLLKNLCSRKWVNTLLCFVLFNFYWLS